MNDDLTVIARGGKCILNKTDIDLVQSLVNHVIVASEWQDDCEPGETDWTGHEYALLTLDDGRVIRFGGFGYDAWGATVSLES